MNAGRAIPTEALSNSSFLHRREICFCFCFSISQTPHGARGTWSPPGPYGPAWAALIQTHEHVYLAGMIARAGLGGSKIAAAPHTTNNIWRQGKSWRLLFFLFFATTCRGSVVWSLSPERERERQRTPPTIQYVGLPLASMFCFCSTRAAPMSRRGAFPLYPLESKARVVWNTL